MLKEFIEKRVKDQKVIPHLLNIDNAIKSFKDVWMIRSANITTRNISKFSFSFGTVVDLFAILPDIEGMEFLKICISAYAQLDRYDADDITKILSLKFEPKNEEEKRLKEEILPSIRKKAIDSWIVLKTAHPKTKFTENENLKPLWDKCQDIINEN